MPAEERDQPLAESLLGRLSRPAPGRFFLSLAGDWLGIAAGFWLFHSFPGVPAFFGASVLIGLSQHALAVLGHEAVHYSVCRNRFLNDLIGGFCCFFPLGLTVSIYRDFHFPHHRDPGGAGDPELPIRRAMGKSWEAPFSLQRGFQLWAASFFGTSLRELGIFVAMLPRGSKVERAAMGLFWAGVLALVYQQALWAYLGLWFYAQATTYFSTLRIQAWYEHSLGTPETNRYSIPGPLFFLLIPHNAWVHYEHHHYPSVPFYRLPELRELTAGEPVLPFREMEARLGRGVSPSREEKIAA